MKLPWPELPSSHRPAETMRQILDYLVWIASTLGQPGFQSSANVERWRRRIHEAYRALFLPPVSGHGDRYPADVPPALRPGVWPDVPASGPPGMTVRHQLKVIELLGEELRDRVWPHGREPEFQEWDRRLSQARLALDQGDGPAMPAEAGTTPSRAALEEARAQDDARREHARRRERRLKRLMVDADRRRASKETEARAAPAPEAPLAAPDAATAAPKARAAGKAARPQPAKPKASGKQATGTDAKARGRKKAAVRSAPKRKPATRAQPKAGSKAASRARKRK